ncbi:3-demethylubiquinone-9 3-methyltransferase [Plasmopara halstedii]|uniref:Ubiquinone biosynthesis O-methyltransferase, mitochondrial n=1 Tax=Plasmopara halstedii TaxID=4781 RepID=A0A0P1AJ29_PLAHL|nr:3-demethylubiquinone-9 3-methyltransferase [Plasmopara halstedii]CEG41236.1 3-demethylubiquinone-9 3-methyltransferase [Plasmopara halstedii]|eukprot:XP_024577605.1 3-demethylubiquinone-9 3-methyltransferase [Plasmopara halstedii]
MLAKRNLAAQLYVRGFSARVLSTVVKNEVQKFNAAASDWWTPKSRTGVGPLHQINPVRVKYIRSHVIMHFGHTNDDDPMPLRGLRVADVGCGGGILSESLCRIGGTMVSIDPGKENIAAATEHAATSCHTNKIEYRQCTSDDLVKQGEIFDVVCSLEVIEHVSSVPAFLQSLTPLVKPGGLLFLSSINRTVLSAALAIGAAEYMLRIIPPGTHDWNKFVQPSEIEHELRKDGIIVKDISAVNYIMCAVKPSIK